MEKIRESVRGSFVLIKRRPRLRRLALASYSAMARASLRLRGAAGALPELHMVDSAAEWVSRNPVHGEIRPNLFPPEEVVNRLPRGPHAYPDWEYRAALAARTPAPFTATIASGHVVDVNGAVAAPDGALIRDVSLPVGEYRVAIWGINGTIQDPVSLCRAWDLPPRRLKGTAVVMSVLYGRNYYHWTFDALPRLNLVKEAGMDLSEIDHFIVSSYHAPFQVESLASLGITRDRVVSNIRYPHLVAENLIVPSLTRPTGAIPGWACEYLRNIFPPKQPGSRVGRKIFVVRKSTDHDLLSGEARLTEILEDNGFQAIATEDYSMPEKAWIFRNAEVIVGASGSGLTNVVFSEPGATVVELRARAYPTLDAWDVGNRRGLDWYDVVPDRYGRDDSYTIALNPGSISAESVMETLEYAGVL